LALNCNFIQLILFAIPWSLILAYSGSCSVFIIIWQITYFIIICYYLKLKLIIINTNINSFRRELGNQNIIQLLKSLQSIHNEIKEFNNNYWSKFLFWYCIIFIQIIALLVYQTLFAKLNIMLRLIYIYSALNGYLFLIVPLNSASSLVMEANKSHLFVNYLFLKYNKFINVHNKIKVKSL
jgi:hypothetical protein